ncbi:phosphoenolpyruvate synthase [Paenarthrobacter sp. JL.01a]|uniref:phosphoenolpyruvate synthase n=1 Tax=Paenarthrobacter sp. JL.01a TaxID=2979324 RepID=UPI0021C8925F|nr:phosphoenolpyruvate synthase [Paenarthrobacter sp. JL.01a]UXM93504.1 phosphoenolpyruvate synthase [Paenarthrobacter sp. JL.01a]
MDSAHEASLASAHVLWFEKTGIGDIFRVGGKNASLGELTQALRTRGVKVPDGFATTVDAYRQFLALNGLEKVISGCLDAYRSGDSTLREAGDAIRQAILAAEIPPGTAASIRESYIQLCRRTGEANVAVAVRSSATAEDLPDASFAGQQETYLNVSGIDAVLEACRKCYASLFTDRAISYREIKNFGHLDVALSVGIQRMVRSDAGASGVMFSIDTESGFPRCVVISATWGLGETVVQGTVNPDKYQVFKPFLVDRGLVPIIQREVGSKEQKLIYSQDGNSGTLMVKTTRHEQKALVLSDAEVLTLARWAVAVEEHYGRPMDMEWAKDGTTGELFMVQARPETVQTQRQGTTFNMYHLHGQGRVLTVGAAVGDAIAAGTVSRVLETADIDSFVDGSILVTRMTDPDWVPVMKRAAAIVTDHGGPTSHAAIISRELGVPAIVGTGNATQVLKPGSPVTVSCSEGEQGRVYEGALDYDAEEVDTGTLPATQTQLMVNIGSPAAALRWWRLPAAGVGLARMEFIINNLIRVHPMALVHPERVTDDGEAAAIASLWSNHRTPHDYFIDVLATGIAKIAATFHPKPVVVRLSDFKSNEYGHLIGGRFFERPEENPMLGFRGASRYYSTAYREAFALECRALKRVRETAGFNNVIVMVPFCRTVQEGEMVLEVMAKNGLVRGQNGLEIYMMCEIPSNVVRAAEFARLFDGFSIGSNDLTQLVLGIDRDSEQLSDLFDERDPAVTAMISQAIREAHKAGIKIGLCGQGPSNHPDFAEFLVGEEIDSISLNPDTFLRTLPLIADAEFRWL